MARERPILFTGPMVCAIREGRKTQTRRVMKPQPWCNKAGQWLWKDRRSYQQPFHPGLGPPEYPNAGFPQGGPYGVPGDRLWAKESWWALRDTRPSTLSEIEFDVDATDYDCDGVNPRERWQELGWVRKSSRFMPRWASRFLLEITEVRVERVQEISTKDARAEGIGVLPGQNANDRSAWWESAPGLHQGRTAEASFRLLWDSLNAKRGHTWQTNPWVWVVLFKLLKGE